MADNLDLDEARRRFRRAAERAVTRWGERILGGAQRRAPLREGTLRASGDLEIVDTGRRIYAEVSFNEVYAARQHEETDWDHPLAGEAKYLERELADQAGLGETMLELELRREGIL